VTQNAILGESESRYLATGLATQCLLGYTYNNREVYQIAEAMSTIEQSFFTFPCNLPGSALRKVCLHVNRLHVSCLHERVGDSQELYGVTQLRRLYLDDIIIFKVFNQNLGINRKSKTKNMQCKAIK